MEGREVVGVSGEIGLGTDSEAVDSHFSTRIGWHGIGEHESAMDKHWHCYYLDRTAPSTAWRRRGHRVMTIHTTSFLHHKTFYYISISCK